MNVLLFLTDQQRSIQHFPRGWGRRHLPGLTRLQEHGMLFEHAFTNACMCSPARSTLMSGYFPAQHGVKYTLETDMPAPQYPQVELSTSFKNLASVSRAAGYTPGRADAAAAAELIRRRLPEKAPLPRRLRCTISPGPPHNANPCARPGRGAGRAMACCTHP
jgi:hypothetical protein